jgi:uncharacterized membrane-anchored protein
MNDTLSKRLRAAVAAGWWTVLIFYVLLVAGWLIALALLHARPEWLRFCWGGKGMTWEAIQAVYMVFFGVVKMLLLVALFGVVWLTLWSRRLRQMAG